jgi:hypothetical protein
MNDELRRFMRKQPADLGRAAAGLLLLTFKNPEFESAKVDSDG